MKKRKRVKKKGKIGKRIKEREEISGKSAGGSGVLSVFLIIILLLLLVVLAFLTYFLYQLVPGDPEMLEPIIKKPGLNTGNLSYDVGQFYPNMKFNHNDISYKFDNECDEYNRLKVLEAFSELSSRVGVINFHSTLDNPDIEISCSEYMQPTLSRGFFIAGEGGAKEVIPTGSYHVILNGIILLYGNSGGTIQCDWPILELHELLHVFGFGHSTDENSIMYSYLESCDQKLDDSIVMDLKNLYSQENLPDLYFENLVAVKKGTYLDFNVTIKNSGVVDAEGVSLFVFDDKRKIKKFDLNDVSFGGGISFQVSNLKLKSRSSDNIEIVIDPYNLVKELDEGNNIARLG